MDKVKVSVILPVYNVEKYLRECIDSLINQTLKEIEIICVDDGSTDSSLEILNEYKARDNRIVVIEQHNMYAGVARNNGMDIAKGEYMLFLDSDDFFNETLLEKTYRQAIKTNADIVFFGAEKYNEVTGEFEQAPWYFNRTLLPGKEVFSKEDVPDVILKITSPMPWTKLFRREFISSQNIRFQPLHNSNDVFFTLTAVSVAERISYVDEDLVYYRVGLSQNLQSTKAKHPLCFLEAYEAVYNELKKRNIIDSIKIGFINIAVSGCAYNIDSAKDHDVRIKVIEALAESDFVNDFLLTEPFEAYLNAAQYQKVRGCRYAYEQYQHFQNVAQERETVCLKKAEFKETPLVSVIVPVYNVENYLKECLDSVLNQTLGNIEIICINDGSTDKSLDVLFECIKDDNRVSVYEHRNSGLSYTRNIGIEKAVGEYVYFMDSDDIIELNTLERLYSVADDNGKCDIVFFNADSFADSEECEESLETFKDYYYRKRVYNGVFKGEDLALSMLENEDYRSSACLQLTKREHLLKNGLKFYVGIIHEDELFTICSILTAEKAMFINDVLFKRRVRASSIMTTSVSFKNVYGYFCAAYELMDFIKTHEMGNNGLLAADIKLKALLRSARTRFNRLRHSEKYSRYGIPKKLQPFFDVLVTDPASQDLSISRKNKKLKAKDKENRHLEKKLGSMQNLKFYKLYRLLTLPVRLIKKLFR